MPTLTCKCGAHITWRKKLRYKRCPACARLINASVEDEGVIDLVELPDGTFGCPESVWDERKKILELIKEGEHNDRHSNT